jgi:N-acetylmuramoyl-L-alanine amidase
LSSSRTPAASRSGIRLLGCTIIASAVALALLPVQASHAGFFDFLRGKKSDAPKSSGRSRHAPPARQATPARHPTPKEAAASLQAAVAKLRPVKPEAAEGSPPSKQVARKCEPAKFRLVVDVGHTRKSDGALSARNVPEYDFNLRLATRLVEKLKSEGFERTRLMITEGKARPSLLKRVASANGSNADLFLSIHHDSVPDKFMEDWEFEGRKSKFSDRFAGWGLFVSHDNADFEASFAFARMIGKRMKANGYKFADQYSMPIMGKYRRDLLDRAAGVYRYDNLVVLMRTRMPAVLLEAGSIINRDEELEVASTERQDKTIGAVTDALKEYCGVPEPPLQASADHK